MLKNIKYYVFFGLSKSDSTLSEFFKKKKSDFTYMVSKYAASLSLTNYTISLLPP